MSKAPLVLAGAVLAALGFALGYSAATRSAATGPAAPSAAAGPEAAIREALADRDPYARAARLAALLPTLGPDAVAALRSVLEDTAIDLAAADHELLVRAWAARAPSEAATWSFLTPPEAFRLNAVVAAIETWAAQDPQAAAQMIQAMGLAQGPNVDSAEIALVRGWYDSGKPNLEKYINDLGLSFERQRALRIFARRTIQRKGPQAVVAWAEAIPDGDERYKLDAFRQVGIELAMADTQAAVAFCEAYCDQPYGLTMRQLIAQRWASEDGAAALAWLAKAPEGSERDRAVQEAVRIWWRKDAEGMDRFAQEMGVDAVEPWFRPAAGMYAGLISQKRPEEAVLWAALVEDDEKRERAYVQIARRWRLQDEAAAEAWLAQSPLSEEARESVRNPQPAKMPRRGGPRRERQQKPQPE